MFTSHAATELTIRHTRSDDDERLTTLAVLDSARPLHGDALVAEVDGTPIAALELEGGRAVADPFRRSAPAVDMLRVHADRLRGGRERRRIKRRSLLRPRRPGFARTARPAV